MTDRDPKADGLDLAIGWLQKSIDELADVTRRVREVAPGTTPTTQTKTSDLPPIPTTTLRAPVIGLRNRHAAARSNWP